VTYHDFITDTLSSISDTELDKLKTDLNNPEKSINDILADLASENKYEGTQTVNTLTTEQISHIQNNSTSAKHLNELDLLAESFLSKYTQNTQYVRGGELILGPEALLKNGLFQQSGDKYYYFKTSVIGATFENETDNVITKVLSEKKISVEIPGKYFGSNLLRDTIFDNTSEDSYSNPAHINPEHINPLVVHFYNIESDKNTTIVDTNGDQRNITIKMIDAYHLSLMEYNSDGEPMHDGIIYTSLKTFRAFGEEALGAELYYNTAVEPIYVNVDSNGAILSELKVQIKYVENEIDNTERDLRFSIKEGDNNSYSINLKIGKVREIDYDENTEMFGTYGFFQHSTDVVMTAAGGNLYRNRVIKQHTILDKNLIIGKNAKLTVKNTTIEAGDKSITVIGNHHYSADFDKKGYREMSNAGLLLTLVKLLGGSVDDMRKILETDSNSVNTYDESFANNRINFESTSFNGNINLVNVDAREINIVSSLENTNIYKFGGNADIGNYISKSFYDRMSDPEEMYKLENGLYKISETKYMKVGALQRALGIKQIRFIPGSYPGEISWQIKSSEGSTILTNTDIPSFSGSLSPDWETFSADVNKILPPGTYTIIGEDGYGDGWNGGEVRLIDFEDNEIISFTVDGPSDSVDFDLLPADQYLTYINTDGNDSLFKWDRGTYTYGMVKTDGGSSPHPSLASTSSIQGTDRIYILNSNINKINKINNFEGPVEPIVKVIYTEEENRSELGPGYTTYQLSLKLSGDNINNCYTIFGTEDNPMEIPSSYQPFVPSEQTVNISISADIELTILVKNHVPSDTSPQITVNSGIFPGTWQTLSEGSKQFSDRDYILTNVPEDLLGHTFYQGPCHSYAVNMDITTTGSVHILAADGNGDFSSITGTTQVIGEPVQYSSMQTESYSNSFGFTMFNILEPNGQTVGSNVGGTDPVLLQALPSAKYDGWLTVGKTTGDTTGDLGSVGINFDSWNESDGLIVNDGAVFWMNHSNGPTTTEVVVAQFTTKETNWTAKVNAQGKSISGDDWDIRGITFTPPEAVFTELEFITHPISGERLSNRELFYYSDNFHTTMSEGHLGIDIEKRDDIHIDREELTITPLQPIFSLPTDDIRDLGIITGKIEEYESYEINPLGDFDLFKLTLTRPGVAGNYVGFANADTNIPLNLNLELYDSLGNLIPATFKFLTREIVDFNNKDAGEYYLKVYHTSNGDTGRYNVTFNLLDAGEYVDLGILTGLENDNAIENLEINTLGDVDLYRLEVTSESSVGNRVAINPSEPQMDITIELYSAFGRIAKATRKIMLDESSLIAPLDELWPGVYFLKIYSETTTGSYSLAYKFTECPIGSGDVNEDGVFDVADLTIITTNIINNTVDTDPCFKATADVNRDGVVDVRDTVQMARVILNGGGDFDQNVLDSGETKLSAVKTENENTINIYHTSDTPIYGLQFNIDGVTVTNATVVPGDFNVFFSETTVLGFSFVGSSIPANWKTGEENEVNPGLLMTITFEGNPGDINISNLVISGENGSNISVNDLLVYFTLDEVNNLIGSGGPVPSGGYKVLDEAAKITNLLDSELDPNITILRPNDIGVDMILHLNVSQANNLSNAEAALGSSIISDEVKLHLTGSLRELSRNLTMSLSRPEKYFISESWPQGETFPWDAIYVGVAFSLSSTNPFVGDFGSLLKITQREMVILGGAENRRDIVGEKFYIEHDGESPWNDFQYPTNTFFGHGSPYDWYADPPGITDDDYNVSILKNSQEDQNAGPFFFWREHWEASIAWLKENYSNFYSNIEEVTLRKWFGGNPWDTTDEWIDALLNAYELGTVTYTYTPTMY
jgi:hypothetical protein